MALLEAQAQRMAAEEEVQRQILAGANAVRTAAKGAGTGGNISFVRGETALSTTTIQTANPDEIDIDDEDDDEDEEDDGKKAAPVDDMAVEQQTVPSAVFGSLAVPNDDDN